MPPPHEVQMQKENELIIFGIGAALAVALLAKPTSQAWQKLNTWQENTSNNLGNWIVPDYEQIWEVDYAKKPSSFSSLQGSKPWLNPLQRILPSQALAHGLSAPAGTLWQSLNPRTDRARGSGGHYSPNRYSIRNYLGERQNSLIGDIRALYCMHLVFDLNADQEIHTLGTFVWNLANGESGHDFGYAIDIGTRIGGSANADSTMNNIIEGAKQYEMPIAWISPYPEKNGRWPIFQLRASKKIKVSSTGINHSNPHHYHVMFPRPNFVLDWVHSTF